MPTSKQDEEFSSEMASYVKITSDSLDNAIYWISKNLQPEDVFDAKDLEAWAESNGYTKE